MYYKSNQEFIRRPTYLEFCSSDHLVYENELLRKDNRMLRQQLEFYKGLVNARHEVLQVIPGAKDQVHSSDDIRHGSGDVHGPKRWQPTGVS